MLVLRTERNSLEKLWCIGSEIGVFKKAYQMRCSMTAMIAGLSWHGLLMIACLNAYIDVQCKMLSRGNLRCHSVKQDF